jgi:hypothetical protein
MTLRKREAWLTDIETRQRNVVFPDTTTNEGRFWRNIITGKQNLTFVQVFGIVLIFVTLGAALFSLITSTLRVSSLQGTFIQRLVGNFGGWIIALGLVVFFLLILRYAVGRESRLRKL